MWFKFQNFKQITKNFPKLTIVGVNERLTDGQRSLDQGRIRCVLDVHRNERTSHRSGARQVQWTARLHVTSVGVAQRIRSKVWSSVAHTNDDQLVGAQMRSVHAWHVAQAGHVTEINSY